MMSCEIASAAAGHPRGGARLHHIMQAFPEITMFLLLIRCVKFWNEGEGNSHFPPMYFIRLCLFRCWKEEQFAFQTQTLLLKEVALNSGHAFIAVEARVQSFKGSFQSHVGMYTPSGTLAHERATVAQTVDTFRGSRNPKSFRLLWKSLP